MEKCSSSYLGLMRRSGAAPRRGASLWTAWFSRRSLPGWQSAPDRRILPAIAERRENADVRNAVLSVSLDGVVIYFLSKTALKTIGRKPVDESVPAVGW